VKLKNGLSRVGRERRHICILDVMFSFYIVLRQSSSPPENWSILFFV